MVDEIDVIVSPFADERLIPTDAMSLRQGGKRRTVRAIGLRIAHIMSRCLEEPGPPHARSARKAVHGRDASTAMTACPPSGARSTMNSVRR